MLLLSAVLIGTLIVAVQLERLIATHHARLKQQFHSDAIALVALFGDEGLRKLRAERVPKNLSTRETFATGLLLQRFIVAYWIRRAFSASEWKRMIIADAQHALDTPLLRARWQEVQKWYPDDIRRFMATLLGDAASSR